MQSSSDAGKSAVVCLGGKRPEITSLSKSQVKCEVATNSLAAWGVMEDQWGQNEADSHRGDPPNSCGYT